MRKHIKDKKRIVIKIGSSSLTHPSTGDINYRKLEHLVRILSDLKNDGKEVVLVSSGAQAVGRKEIGLNKIPSEMPKKQALAAVGQAKLMMTYQRLFSEYSQTVAQILMTRYSIEKEESRNNTINTFNELLNMGVIPVVNENDTEATHEIEIGDNDHLSAYVVSLIKADLLIILSDIDGFYNDDPSTNENAKLFSLIEEVTDEHYSMGKSTSSSRHGTGGMNAKVDAARIVCDAGSEMILVNGKDLNIIYDVMDGKEVGTYFKATLKENFKLEDYL